MTAGPVTRSSVSTQRISAEVLTTLARINHLNCDGFDGTE
jgi:hypothetical protein